MRLFKSKQQKDDEAFLRGWNGPTPLEQERERRKMKAHEIATRLSQCEPKSPAYILLSHELDLRIVKAQNLPRYLALATTFLGFFLGWGLSQWKPFESHTSLDIIAHHIQEQDKRHASCDCKNPNKTIVNQSSSTSGAIVIPKVSQMTKPKSASPGGNIKNDDNNENR